MNKHCMSDCIKMLPLRPRNQSELGLRLQVDDLDVTTFLPGAGRDTMLRAHPVTCRAAERAQTRGSFLALVVLEITSFAITLSVF